SAEAPTCHPAPPSFPTRRSSDLGSVSRQCPMQVAHLVVGSKNRWRNRDCRQTKLADGCRFSESVPFHPAMRRSTLYRAETRRKRSEEHTSELQSRSDLACRLLLE